jgi:Barstar (barnase inhibitor)
MKIVKLDGHKIAESFHDYFAEEFGFPDFYGGGMDAWIDCMTYLDEPTAGMSTKIFVQPDESIVFHINHVKFLKEKHPESYDDLIECTAFVNYRRIKGGGTPLIYLSFFNNERE